jgi:phosphoglycolate phosphatase
MPPLAAIRHVVFDWNGTLIDDCALAVATVNALRVERGMAPITREEYRRAFRFPIADFYRTIGFEVDHQSFAQLMASYLVRFNAKVDECPLHRGARETLAALRAGGVGVHILSASHRDTLARSLVAKRLHGAFGEVAGLHHELATDKRTIGQALSARLAADPGLILYVGDTDHDYEVASALGWRFLFVDHGHQAADPAAPHCALTIQTLEDTLSHVMLP